MQLIQYWLVGKPAYTMYIYLDELLQGGQIRSFGLGLGGGQQVNFLGYITKHDQADKGNDYC